MDAALLLERGARAEQAAPLLARIAETIGASPGAPTDATRGATGKVSA